jgi:hypothetical protein
MRFRQTVSCHKTNNNITLNTGEKGRTAEGDISELNPLKREGPESIKKL